MSAYSEAYNTLNERQRQAVDYVDGPLLVIAGPGTGKTQLLSTRAAHIVELGSASPQNILCLTYTETGAAEMRLRLARIMGVSGGDVAVHTFHSFGTWLISQYPELFSQQRALQPLDDLGRYRIFETLLSALPLRHALAVRDNEERFIRQGNVVEVVKVFKQAGMAPADVRSTLTTNQKDYESLQPLLDDIFGKTLSAKRLPEIASQIDTYQARYTEGSYGNLLLASLVEAVHGSEAIGKTKPLGDWRIAHMQVVGGKKILKSAARHAALLAAVDLYEKYQATLEKEGRYDYEDMVLWAVQALEQNDDLRSEIAERFQYIMVDEYQDTNGAQNSLLDAILSANPLDAPNIMVVGDDDQAIMRFQGAELSGLLQFIKHYEPALITLTDNYRSGQAILDASRQVMIQTDERLEATLTDLSLNKSLQARVKPEAAKLTHQLYLTETAQYQGVANQVSDLLKKGVAGSEIAIIGRKHKELIALTPFMQANGITVNYDYREDILADRRIAELLQLAHYVQLLSGNSRRADTLLANVLAGHYWQIEPLALYRLASEAKLAKTSWLDTMLNHDDKAWQHRAEWLLAAAASVKNNNFTTDLDMLIGRTPLETNTTLTAPYATYLEASKPENYISLLSHLLRLREAVLQSRPNAVGLQDLLDTLAEYRRSGIQLVDSNPLLRGDQAGVTLLSAHGAKGREFTHVIILSAVDKVWGKRASGHNQSIYLPENLPLYPAGDNESDRLRLLYVAMTRAKSHLTITSYEQTEDGKPVVPLSYLQSGGEDQDWWQPEPVTLSSKSITHALEAAWQPQSQLDSRSLQSTLAPLLQNYRLSPTALGSFLNICYAGPQSFLESSVLGFPSAYTASSALGQAAHTVIEQAQRAYANNEPLNDVAVLELFNLTLDASGLPAEELQSVRAHGEQFLPQFIAAFTASDFGKITSTEQFFKTVLPIGNVPFGGKVDALIEDDNNITVIDYKTGKPPLPDWQTTGLSEGKKISLHFYRQQLMCYKLLLDNTSLLGNKKVSAAELIFVEPAEDAEDYVRLTITDFSQQELTQTAKLISAVYECVKQGDLPDVSDYSKDLKGILQFEADLLSK